MPGKAPFKAFLLNNKVAYAISYNGKIYNWNNATSYTRFDLSFLNSVPKQIEELDKVSISSISCNDKITMYLSDHGKLYVSGDDANLRSGILGLGDIYFQTSPILLDSLKSINIIDVSLGTNHVSALASSGDIYVWGYGAGVQKRSNTPLKLDTKESMHGKQVLSMRCETIILNSKIYNKLR